MLRNVLRRVLCHHHHHRLRLASLAFLTVVILACYLLAFIHLESFALSKDSGHPVQGLGRGVGGMAGSSPPCGSLLMEDAAWKRAAEAVLGDAEKPRAAKIGDDEPAEEKELGDDRGGKRRRGGRMPWGGGEGLSVNRFQEIFDRICNEYSKRSDSISEQTSPNDDNNSNINNNNDDDEEEEKAGIDSLKELMEVIDDARVKMFGRGEEMLKHLRASKAVHLNVHKDLAGSNLPAWRTFQNRISQFNLYEDDQEEEEEEEVVEEQEEREDEDGEGGARRRRRKKGGLGLVDRLVKDLASLGIQSVDEVSGLGTQLKYIFNLEDGSRALFKPMRVPRDAEESLDTYYMYEKERHTSEIAAFHLDRILGFRRVPPAAGRVIDMISDLQVFLGQHSRKKFYLSPVGNQCFFGKCLYYCDPAHGVCGDGRRLEGSFVAFLPNKSSADWVSIRNPWIRSYSKHNRSFWERETDGARVCTAVRGQPPFNEWYPLLNVVDVHVFDFLIGNKDRHHFHFFTKFGNSSNFVLIDNGKGFGRYSHDIVDILAPLYQCCMIRYTTLKRLYAFHSQPEMKLSLLMERSLSADVLPQILTPAHLRALDRRVRIILQQVVKCISDAGDPEKVVIDDDLFKDPQLQPP